MSTGNSFLEDFTEKLTMVPNDINRFLRLIRLLDRRVEAIQRHLIKDQKQMLSKMKDLREKDRKQLSLTMELYNKELKSKVKVAKITVQKSLPIPLQEIFEEYLRILDMEYKVVGYAREKSAISSQLSAEVRDYYKILETEVKAKILKEMSPEEVEQANLKGMTVNELANFVKKRKQKEILTTSVGIKKREEFFYTPKVDKYCYCGEASFGDMVFCQNLYCEREWFHLTCINEKSLPDRWFCKECQAMKDKTKNPICKSYFSLA